MATKISELSVKLSANATDFSAKLSAATTKLNSFGSSALSIGGTAAIGVGAALAAVAAAAVAAAGVLAYYTSKSLEAIDANAKLADRLGISTEALGGLQFAAGHAGVSQEALTGGIEKMLKSLGGAADDGELASNAFTKLGLNAAELANLPTDQALGKIADRLTQIKNPAERAASVVAVFGKQGQQLLPLLTQGSAGIAAAQEKAKLLNLTMSRVQSAQVEHANDAMNDMWKILDGVGNSLAVAVAPYLEYAATKLTDFATQGGGIGPKVSAAFEWVTHAIATASDYLELLPAGFHGFRAGALEAIAGVIGALDDLAQGMAKVINFFGGHVQWTALSDLKQGFEQVAQEEAGKFDEAMAKFHRGDNSAAVTKLFDQIKAASTTSAQATADNAAKMQGAFQGIEDKSANLKKVADTLTELQKEVSQFGLSDAQKKIADLQTNGADADTIAKAQKLLNIKDQLEAVNKISTGDALGDYAAKMEKLQQLYAQGIVTAQQFQAIRETAKQSLTNSLTDAAKSITEDVKTPLEKYNDSLTQLNELLNRGLINKETFERAQLKAKQTLESNNDKSANTGQTAIRAGSADALKLAFENSRGVSALNRDDTPKKQLNAVVASNGWLDKIERNTRTVSNATGDVQVVDID